MSTEQPEVYAWESTVRGTLDESLSAPIDAGSRLWLTVSDYEAGQ